jgi:hypothetical protein
MSDFSNTRRLKLRIYFTDSPSPIEVENVCHIGTEGGLLRIITESETQWWPLCHVFNIRKLAC